MQDSFNIVLEYFCKFFASRKAPATERGNVDYCFHHRFAGHIEYILTEYKKQDRDG